MKQTSVFLPIFALLLCIPSCKKEDDTSDATITIDCANFIVVDDVLMYDDPASEEIRLQACDGGIASQMTLAMLETFDINWNSAKTISTGQKILRLEVGEFKYSMMLTDTASIPEIRCMTDFGCNEEDWKEDFKWVSKCDDFMDHTELKFWVVPTSNQKVKVVNYGEDVLTVKVNP